ncbi:MAG TPA: hypothetical protein VGO47_05055, partial [Chlamydiales bacterium]|nr:hypothetical protein [Chlamydiales bacterium]
ELVSLLKERKELADAYYTSLEKKSGIFGSRTKNDLRDSQEKLVEIVRADNKIMNTLNRTLDYRNFEKQNMSYTVNSSDDRIRNLSMLNDTLTRQVTFYLSEIKICKATIRRNNIYFIIILAAMIAAFAFRMKKFLRR